jgi:hypothetical protein
MPTVNRKKEVFDFIESLAQQWGLNALKLNLYIIDQNKEEILCDLDTISHDNIKIIYTKSADKGLSLNRNYGLDKINRGIVSFPDDDCVYFEDTLKSVIDYFDANPTVDIVIGRIFDRRLNKNIIKNWPEHDVVVNKFNFYQLSSSITIFCRDKPSIQFDSRLGAGSKFGSCEDPDFLYRLLKLEKKVVYTPSIDVWHPEPDVTHISLQKVQAYACGFGAFVNKEFDLIKMYLLLACVAKKSYQYLFLKKNYSKGYFKAFFKGLYYGLINFNK